MARDMSNPNDLVDVSLPASAGRSREVDPGHANDQRAQAQAAAQLAYSLHGGRCHQCANAESESDLCQVGGLLYSRMRSAGCVA